MKKISIILTIVIAISTISCKKFLDTKAEDFSVPEQYYSTEEQLNAALAGVYQSLSTTGTYGMYLSMFLVQSTDEAFYRNTSPNPNTMAYDFTASDNYISRTWKDLYEGINRANYLLANLDKPVMDENKRKIIKGEALFLRAFMYFQLVTYWGDVPLLLEPSVDSRKVNNPRTPSKDVFAQILKDMIEAKGLVNSYIVNGNPVHVSKTAIEGILARVCLKMAGQPLNDVSKYADAKAWADSVIQSGVHSLNLDYKQIFINESADLYDNKYKETLWEIEFYGNNRGPLKMAAGFVPYIAVINNDNSDDAGRGYARVAVTGYFFKKFDPADLRRDWAIAPYSFYKNKSTIEVLKDPNDFYTRQVGKWRRKYETVAPRHTETSATNFPIIRYSDVLLMYAEAENALNGPTAAAYDAINQVRRRAFGIRTNKPTASLSVVKDIQLSNSGNTGYLKTVLSIPVTISGGGGSGAVATATVSASTGKVSWINLISTGSDYKSVPTVTIGTGWASNTFYQKGIQVFSGNNLYTVTKEGTSTSIPPIQETGESSADITGAVFTSAGHTATATATIGESIVDLSGLNQTSFQDEIMDERARELSFEGLRKFDLIRWGKFVNTMKIVGADQEENVPSSLRYSVRPYDNVSEKHLLFPIPTLELSLNNAIEQNPLWK